jgi:hypothetical protein
MSATSAPTVKEARDLLATVIVELLPSDAV